MRVLGPPSLTFPARRPSSRMRHAGGFHAATATKALFGARRASSNDIRASRGPWFSSQQLVDEISPILPAATRATHGGGAGEKSVPSHRLRSLPFFRRFPARQFRRPIALFVAPFGDRQQIGPSIQTIAQRRREVSRSCARSGSEPAPVTRPDPARGDRLGGVGQPRVRSAGLFAETRPWPEGPVSAPCFDAGSSSHGPNSGAGCSSPPNIILLGRPFFAFFTSASSSAVALLGAFWTPSRRFFLFSNVWDTAGIFSANQAQTNVLKGIDGGRHRVAFRQAIE